MDFFEITKGEMFYHGPRRQVWYWGSNETGYLVLRPKRLKPFSRFIWHRCNWPLISLGYWNKISRWFIPPIKLPYHQKSGPIKKVGRIRRRIDQWLIVFKSLTIGLQRRRELEICQSYSRYGNRFDRINVHKLSGALIDLFCKIDA